MNKQQDNQLKMFLLLKTFFQGTTPIYSTNPLLVQAVATLTDNINEIFELEAKASPNYYTETKADSKTELVALLLNYHARLMAWFIDHPDQNAPMETRLSPSTIKYASDARLLLIAAKMVDYVQANLPALASFGLNAATQTAVQEAIANFETLSDMPQRERANRRQNIQTVADAILKTRKLVREKISIYMRTYAATEPSFYSRYTISAKLGKPGTQTMALRVNVQTANGQPLSGCPIIIRHSGTEKPVKTVTKTSGQVNIQNLPDGPGTVTVTLPDGNEQMQEVEIKPSERVDVVFVMEG